METQSLAWWQVLLISVAQEAKTPSAAEQEPMQYLLPQTTRFLLLPFLDLSGGKVLVGCQHWQTHDSPASASFVAGITSIPQLYISK